MEDYLENCAHVKVDMEVLESLLKPENLEVSLRYVQKYSSRCGSNFSSSSTHQRSRTTLWQVEDDGWRVKEKMVHGKRVGKTSGMILSIKEQWQNPAVPRKDPKNAVAAAKLVVSQRRRRPLGLDGRQAKARHCL